jgi:thymidylate synthase
MFPPLVDDSNLTKAWARVFVHLQDSASSEISPLLFSLTGFHEGEAVESQSVRELLDSTLRECELQKVHTVANTIFPQKLWKRANDDRHLLYGMYAQVFPRLRAIAPHKNSRGLYFQRLTAFGPNKINQLEFVISEYNKRKNVRRSMLQASIFDPDSDHTRTAQLIFPCLQHVSFIPTEHGLVINGFYATQVIFERCYGNLLGLARLGAFMASQLQMPLYKLNCFVGVERRDFQKTDPKLQELLAACRALLAG